MKHSIETKTVLTVQIQDLSVSLGDALCEMDIGEPIDFSYFLRHYDKSMLYSEKSFFVGLAEQPDLIQLLD